MLSGLGQVAAQAQERAYEWGWSSVSWQELVTRRSPTRFPADEAGPGSHTERRCADSPHGVTDVLLQPMLTIGGSE